MRRVMVVVACVTGLLWVAPVTGAAPAPAQAAAATGVVNVIYGSASGRSATTIPDRLWSQGSPNVEGTANPGDEFGSSLAAS
jgi:hypothetical protein